MMERPSLHQNWILKCNAFRAGRGLRIAAMITFKWSQAMPKHTDQWWKATPQPILAGSTSHSLSPQIASTGTHPTMLSP